MGLTDEVASLLGQLEPLDDRERADQQRALAWVAGTGDIWRRAKPATPTPHLVSYVLLVDPDQGSVGLRG